jgi:hypothetical protein
MASSSGGAFSIVRVGAGTVVVVVGSVVLVVVVAPLEVVVASVSDEQAALSTARTSRRERRRYMVDLEVVVRSPSRDLPRTLTV